MITTCYQCKLLFFFKIWHILFFPCTLQMYWVLSFGICIHEENALPLSFNERNGEKKSDGCVIKNLKCPNPIGISLFDKYKHRMYEKVLISSWIYRYIIETERSYCIFIQHILSWALTHLAHLSCNFYGPCKESF